VFIIAELQAPASLANITFIASGTRQGVHSTCVIGRGGGGFV
jgi:hypothetical protein